MCRPYRGNPGRPDHFRAAGRAIPRAPPGASRHRRPARSTQQPQRSRRDLVDTTVYVPADQPAPASDNAARAVRVRSLAKTYGKGEAVVRALDGVDVDFEEGRFTAI